MIESKLIVKQKENKFYLYGGFGAFLIGVFLLFYLISVKGSSGDFITVFGKLFSIGLIIFGIVYINKHSKYKQSKDAKISIEKNKLIVDDREYLLDNSYLSVRFTKSGVLFNLSLWKEKDNKSVEIFKDFILDLDEMAKFLSMIKPYRKSDICLAKKEIGKIKLFDSGFAFENREFFYKELEKFDTKLIVTEGVYYLDIEIVLKTKEKIAKRLVDGIKEYAKAIYASIVFDSNNFSKYSLEDFLALYCPKKSYLGVAMLVMDIISLGLILYNNKFIALGVIMLLITAFYFSSTTYYKRKLCKEIIKVFLQIHFDKLGGVNG